MKTAIIIPCYNEAGNIVKVISDLKAYGQIIVVDDGSTDNSYGLALNQGVVVLKHYLNRGQGAALETGRRYALRQDFDYIVTFDADGQHLAEEIPNLLQPIIEGKAEVVFGSRFLMSNEKIPLFKKWFILKPAIFFQNLILGAKLTDAHNGFRAFSRSALTKIQISQDGMAHASEIVEEVIRQEIKYLEVPVTIKYAEFGQGLLGGLRIIKDLILGKINK